MDLKDKILIGRKTNSIEELHEWLSKDEDTKNFMIFIIDDDNAVIKKIDKKDIMGAP